MIASAAAGAPETSKTTSAPTRSVNPRTPGLNSLTPSPTSATVPDISSPVACGARTRWSIARERFEDLSRRLRNLRHRCDLPGGRRLPAPSGEAEGVASVVEGGFTLDMNASARPSRSAYHQPSSCLCSARIGCAWAQNPRTGSGHSGSVDACGGSRVRVGQGFSLDPAAIGGSPSSSGGYRPTLSREMLPWIYPSSGHSMRLLASGW